MMLLFDIQELFCLFSSSEFVEKRKLKLTVWPTFTKLSCGLIMAGTDVKLPAECKKNNVYLITKTEVLRIPHFTRLFGESLILQKVCVVFDVGLLLLSRLHTLHRIEGRIL
jgi:hypothetical protein